jgi:hypothetical protein
MILKSITHLKIPGYTKFPFEMTYICDQLSYLTTEKTKTLLKALLASFKIFDEGLLKY